MDPQRVAQVIDPLVASELSRITGAEQGSGSVGGHSMFWHELAGRSDVAEQLTTDPLGAVGAADRNHSWSPKLSRRRASRARSAAADEP